MTEEPREAEVPIEAVEIAIPGFSEPLRFHDLDALTEWINQQEAFWIWVQKGWDRHTELRDWVSPALSAWSRTKELIVQHKANTTSTKERTLVVFKRIGDTLSRPYLEKRILLSSDPRSQYIEIIKREDPLEASFALLAFLDPSKLPNSVPATRGMISAYLFKHGLVEKSAEAEKAALRIAVTEWQTHFSRAQHEESKNRADNEALRKDLSELKESAHQRFAERLESAEAELKSIAHTYDQQLSLEKPVTYWQHRITLHSWWAGGLAIVWLIVAFSSAALTVHLVQAFMLPQLNANGDYVIPPQQIYYWQSFLVIGAILMFLWPLRVLAKLFLSNMHLRTEALERVTMANTFLALIRHEKDFPPEERKLLLEALFRPSSIGLVQEDGAPASVMHAVSKMISGDRR